MSEEKENAFIPTIYDYPRTVGPTMSFPHTSSMSLSSGRRGESSTIWSGLSRASGRSRPPNCSIRRRKESASNLRADRGESTSEFQPFLIGANSSSRFTNITATELLAYGVQSWMNFSNFQPLGTNGSVRTPGSDTAKRSRR